MPDITTLVTTDGHLLKRSGTSITGVDPATLGSAPHPGMATGLYYGAEVNSLSTDTPGLSTMMALPFWVPAATTFDQAALNVTTAAASSSVRVAVYSNANGLPDALEGDLGSVATTVTGDRVFAVSVTLQKGWHWLAAVSQGGAPSVRVGYPPSYVGATPVSGLMANTRTPFKNSVTGAAPATFGTPDGYSYFAHRVLLKKA